MKKILLSAVILLFVTEIFGGSGRPHESKFLNGLQYKFFQGEWTTLPDFNSLTPSLSGNTATINFAPKPANVSDHFGFLWEGQIRIPAPGTYTFEIFSDDGSKLYFNTPYSYGATATVNNDGVHSAASASGSVSVPSAGSYPFALTYFEGILDETLQVFWSGPGFSRQPIPASAFTDAPDTEAPSAPGNLFAPSGSTTFYYFRWDRSTDNFGVTMYDVYKDGVKIASTPYLQIKLTGLTPNTTADYYVKARDAAGNVSPASNVWHLVMPERADGLTTRFFEGDWDKLPDFDEIDQPRFEGGGNISLSVTNSTNDHFGFVWEGMIHIAIAGTYTFEVISDDGSKFYFDKLYSDTALATIDHDALGYASKSVTLNNVQVGMHEFALSYFEKWGNQSVEIYWTGPGIPRQRMRNTAFIEPVSNGQLAGLNYRYVEGDWNSLPDFNALPVIKSGIAPYANLDMRNRNDYFGVIFEGNIKIPWPDFYTFELESDDGSRFYFNKPYSYNAVPTIDNDGLHGDQIPAKATIEIPVAGFYPIALTFFEKWGNENLKLYWSNPRLPRDEVPVSALWHTATPVNSTTSTPVVVQAMDATREVRRSIYPNPFNDKLNLELNVAAPGSGYSVELFDVRGVRVYNQKISLLRSGSNQVQISLKGLKLSPGAYTVTVKNNGLPVMVSQLLKN